MPRTLEQYVEIERREEAVRCSHDRPVGVHFGGMAPEPWPQRSEARILADAQARMDRAGTAPTMFKPF